MQAELNKPVAVSNPLGTLRHDTLVLKQRNGEDLLVPLDQIKAHRVKASGSGRYGAFLPGLISITNFVMHWESILAMEDWGWFWLGVSLLAAAIALLILFIARSRFALVLSTPQGEIQSQWVSDRAQADNLNSAI